MENNTLTKKGLMISRYDNGKIKEINEYIYQQSNLCSPTDKNEKATCHLVGAYLSFYKNGKLKTVSVSGKLNSKTSSTWSKTFNANGEIIRTFGEQGKLKIPTKMLCLLKNEGLLPEIQQTLSKKISAQKPKIILSQQDER